MYQKVSSITKHFVIRSNSSEQEVGKAEKPTFQSLKITTHNKFAIAYVAKSKTQKIFVYSSFSLITCMEIHFIHVIIEPS